MMIDQARDSAPAKGERGWLFGPESSARARRSLILLLFPALALAVTLRFDFVFDDNLVVLEDTLVTGPLNLAAIFGSEVRAGDVAIGYFRPLITLLYWADRAVWGLNPAGYHLTNLLWHLLATALVYWVAVATTGWIGAAWTAAMLFSVLPAHTEAIGWIQGRVDLVSTALALMAFLALTHSRNTGPWRAVSWGGLAGLMFLAALLAKESAAGLPIAWLMWEISGLRRNHWRDRLAGLAVRMTPLFFAGLAYLLLRRVLLGGLVSFPMSLSPLPLRALALLSVLAEYGRVLLFPDLGLNFHRAVMVSATPATLAVGVTVAAAVTGGLVATWRWARPLFPWTAWVPVMLLPPLLFVLYAPAPERGFLTAERFLYLPSVGWCVLLGTLLAWASRGGDRRGWSWWGTATVTGLLLGYAGLTLVRLSPWADAADLYRAMLARPDTPSAMRVLVHNNLGSMYLERAEFPAAREQFQAALNLDGKHPVARNNLGVLLIREGKPAEARPWLETAIRLAPRYGDAYANLGAAFEAMGDLEAARRVYQTGFRVAPGSTRLAGGLARLSGTEPPPPTQPLGEAR